MCTRGMVRLQGNVWLHLRRHDGVAERGRLCFLRKPDKSAIFKMSVVWKWENDVGTEWKTFDSADASFLEEAYQRNEKNIKHPSRPWIFNLAEMTQTNTNSNSKRCIRRDVPLSGQRGLSTVDADKKPMFPGSPVANDVPKSSNNVAQLPSGWVKLQMPDGRVYAQPHHNH